LENEISDKVIDNLKRVEGILTVRGIVNSKRRGN